MQQQIDEVDAIIHDIRTTVFAFSPNRPGHDDGGVTGPAADTAP